MWSTNAASAELAGKVNCSAGEWRQPAGEHRRSARAGTGAEYSLRCPPQVRVVSEIAGQPAYDQTFDLVKREPIRTLVKVITAARPAGQWRAVFPFGV